MVTLDSNLFEDTSINLRQNAGRSHTAQIVFWTFIGVEVLMILVYYIQYGLLKKAQAKWVTNDEIATNDTLVVLVNAVELVIYIIAIVTFIMWFRRAYYNLHQLGLSNLSRSDGWAAGAWFIPIINLYLPYQIMREIWVGMQKFLLEEKEGYSMQGITILGFWWLFYILTNIASSVSNTFTRNADTLDALITSTQLTMIATVISIIGLLLAILVIRKTSDIELELRKTVRKMQEGEEE